MRTLRSCFRRSPLPGGGLYRRQALTLLVIHSAIVRDLASVEALVMCERLVSQRYSSGIPFLGALLLAATFANSSASSLPATVEWAGAHRTVTSLSLVVIRDGSLRPVESKIV